MNKIKKVSVAYFNSKWSFIVWLLLLPFVIGQWVWEWEGVGALVLFTAISVNLFLILVGWWYKRYPK